MTWLSLGVRRRHITVAHRQMPLGIQKDGAATDNKGPLVGSMSPYLLLARN
jgi:hypothetical protein